ncbi:uncharacterized protein LOC142221353 [Haematobia irritans]|uniref:uncharacterized protein LOC142221353 n=1 Tax=Haematobia irritans TaxID=7368 RepID=UPI003F50C0AC
MLQRQKMWNLQTSIFFVIFMHYCKVDSASLFTPIRLGAPAHLVNGVHISLKFYEAAKNGEYNKVNLQNALQNFVENIQKNLSTSSFVNDDYLGGDAMTKRLHNLADYFEYSSDIANAFATAAENFLEVSKSESIALLQKLRQVPSAQHILSNEAKTQLTDYFSEMEYFNVMLSETIDESLEYIVDTLRFVQVVFRHYAHLQREVLQKWNLRNNVLCFNTYIDSLQLWSTKIFKCASSKDLANAYDIYSTTESTIRQIMSQLEFRIQRLYNCFIFGGYQVKCKFLRIPDRDFHPLFTKLDELQQYLDIKTKKGRIPSYRYNNNETYESSKEEECMPMNLHNNQLVKTLKQCVAL